MYSSGMGVFVYISISFALLHIICFLSIYITGQYKRKVLLEQIFYLGVDILILIPSVFSLPQFRNLINSQLLGILYMIPIITITSNTLIYTFVKYYIMDKKINENINKIIERK